MGNFVKILLVIAVRVLLTQKSGLVAQAKTKKTAKPGNENKAAMLFARANLIFAFRGGNDSPPLFENTARTRF